MQRRVSLVPARRRGTGDVAMRFYARALLLAALCTTAAACGGSPSDQAGARPTAVVTASPSERTEQSPADQGPTAPPPDDSTTGRAPDRDPGDGDARPRMPAPGHPPAPPPGNREAPPPGHPQAPPPGNRQAPPPANPQAPPPGNRQAPPPANPQAPSPGNPQAPPPAKPPPTENTAAPLPGGPRNPGPRTVKVSGPTLDGRYREAPLTFEARGTKCTPFTNGGSADDRDAAQVPVTIRELALVQPTPSNPPAFRLVPVQDIEQCAIDVPAENIRPRCDGATLPPFSEEQPVACAVAISFDSDQDHIAQLHFKVEATCTDVTRRPCDQLSDANPAPSSTAPVPVWWTVVKHVNACPVNRPEGVGGNCPGGVYGD